MAMKREARDRWAARTGCGFESQGLSRNYQYALIDLNDGQCASFDVIADWIEVNVAVED